MNFRGPNGSSIPPSAAVPVRPLYAGGGASGDNHDPDALRPYKEELDELPDVREEKVDDLRDAVESGKYYVESEKIAKRVVDEAIREAIQRERPSTP